MLIECQVCHRMFDPAERRPDGSGKPVKYCSPECALMGNRLAANEYSRRVVLPRRRELMQKLILHAGGECHMCSLSYTGRNGPVFQFHHRDKATKLFSIGDQALLRRSEEELMAEVDKCTLVCHNCHAMIHFHPY